MRRCVTVDRKARHAQDEVHTLILLVAALAITAGLRRQREVGGSGLAIGAIQPRISPDGGSIAVSYQGAIWRMPRDGGEMRRLTAGLGFDSNPAWSDDGKRIAYFAGQELRVMDADSGAPIALPAKLRSSGKLYFHPDGKRVLGNFGETPRLSWVDLETGSLKQVVQSTGRIDVFGLSPDGGRIAYVTTQDVDGEQTGHNGPQADVWIVALGRGRGQEARAVPVANLRPLVGPRRPHGRQRFGRRAQRSLDDCPGRFAARAPHHVRTGGRGRPFDFGRRPLACLHGQSRGRDRARVPRSPVGNGADARRHADGLPRADRHAQDPRGGEGNRRSADGAGLGAAEGRKVFRSGGRAVPDAGQRRALLRGRRRRADGAVRELCRPCLSRHRVSGSTSWRWTCPLPARPWRAWS